MIEYNIILNDCDYVEPWDNFSMSISDSWDWEDDGKSIEDYNKFFIQSMVKEGMYPKLEDSDSSVMFNTKNDLLLFVLKWSGPSARPNW
jgi:hypothetical protein